ncbi:MAG: GNAT family protein [Pseudomonadota bacterium]
MQVIEIDADLTLRPMQEPHATDLFKVVDQNRAYLRQWLPWLDQNTCTQHLQAYARASQQRNAGGEAFVQTLFWQDQLVGVAGFNFIDHSNHWGEIGYWLAEEHQGKGIVSRAVQALTDYGFAQLSIHRISISVATDNFRSRAVPERLGYQFEGTLRQCEWLYDRYVDHALYARLKTDPLSTS